MLRKFSHKFMGVGISLLTLSVSAEERIIPFFNQDGSPGNYSSRNVDMSEDGRFIVISGHSMHTLGNNGDSVAVTDMELGTTELLRSPVTNEILTVDANVDMSKNGRYIVLQFPQDPFLENGVNFTYAYDRVNATWTSLTPSLDGSPLQSCSERFRSHAETWSDVSNNGIAVFESTCSNLVSNDTNNASDVFSFDLNTGELRLVSHTPADQTQSADDNSYDPRISADGQTIVFASQADNLSVACNHNGEKLYVYDRDAQSSERLTACFRPQSRRAFYQQAISADGSTIAYNNDLGGLNYYDVASQTTKSIPMPELPAANFWERRSDLSHDGRYFSFFSEYTFDREGFLIEAETGSANMTIYDNLSGKKITINTDYLIDKPVDDFIHPEHAISGNGSKIVFGINRPSRYLNTDSFGENGVYFALDNAPASQYDFIAARNSEDNFASLNGMVLVADHLWSTELNFDGTNDAIKFDVGGTWDDGIDFGDSNNDGVAEMQGANIDINQGAGKYRVTFNDLTLKYTISKLGTEQYSGVMIRGSFNNWDSTPMISHGNNVWEHVVKSAVGATTFKFDIAGDWSENYGDSNVDFFGDLNGNDITVNERTFLVRFYADTKQYSVTPFSEKRPENERPLQAPRVILRDQTGNNIRPLRLSISQDDVWVRDGTIDEIVVSSSGLANNVVSDGVLELRPEFAQPGVFDLSLTITDTNGNSGTDTATATIDEKFAPIARAGQDQTILVGSSVMFDGSASFDTDGTIQAYQWRLDNAFASSNVTTSITFDEIGSYTVELEVRDNDFFFSTDSVTINVVDEITTTDVNFSCLNANTFFEQNVYVVGNIPELGNWNPLDGLLLNTTTLGVDWQGSLLGLAQNQTVEWKCIKVANGQVIWQGGDNNSIAITGASVSTSGTF